MPETISSTVEATLRDCPLQAKEKRALLARALGVACERLIAHPQSGVDAAALERFACLVAERQAGTPMAYVLGIQEFYGHALRVTPAVLIPRPDTEVLVEHALAVLAQRRNARVLDLGTGSGCIAIALARERPDWQIFATDRSPAALRVAQENCLRLGVSIHLAAANWYAPILGSFDLIVSNPPYIASQDAHLGQLTWEPRLALTDEGDGLSALRSVIAGAREHLIPGGRLLVEHGYDQGAAARALMREHGLTAVQTHQDLEGRERLCAGVNPGSAPHR